LLAPALLKATEPDGLTIDEPTDLDEDDAVRARDLIADLSLLYEVGLIERNTDGALSFYALPSLLELTPAGLEATTEDVPEAYRASASDFLEPPRGRAPSCAPIPHARPAGPLRQLAAGVGEHRPGGLSRPRVSLARAPSAHRPR